MGLSSNTLSPVSTYQKRLLNTNRGLQSCPSHLQKSFVTSPRCMGRFQVVLQVFIMEVYLGTMGAFLVPYQTVIIWPLLAGLLMGGQILFCIEDLRTVLAFDLILLAVGFLVCIQPSKGRKLLTAPLLITGKLVGIIMGLHVRFKMLIVPK